MMNHITLRDGLSIELSAGKFAFCSVCSGKIRQLDSMPLPADGTRGEFLASLLERQEALRQGDGPVSVLYDTDRICLVPAEYYREGDAEQYMRLCGIPVTAEIRVAATPPRCDKIALIGVDRELDACLRAVYGDRIAYTHPLFEAAVRESAGPLCSMALTPGFVHLTVHDGGLLFAETLPCSGDPDLFYYLAYLKKNFAGMNFRIELSGTDARDTCRRLSRRFRRVRVYCPEACDFAHLIRLSHENN